MSLAEKLTTVAENTPKVYEAGVEDAKQAEYDAFWDTFQMNGSKTNYDYTFSTASWTDSNLKPKYKIQPTSAERIFSGSRAAQLCCEIDFSNCTNLYMAFQNSSFRELPLIDGSASTNYYYLFNAAYNLRRIEKFIVNPAGRLDGAFVCANLEEVLFDGVICGPTTTRSLDLSPCKLLNKTSIISAVSHLSDDASGFAAKFSLTSVNNAFETSEGAADGSTSQEWLNLVATKPNWTISLI